MNTMSKSGYGIAIDIGTTNIVMALVDTGSREIINELSQFNVNKSFGKDVMSRITMAERGHLEEMSASLRLQLREMIGSIAAGHSIEEIVIACNTTMTHILLCEDCHNLGVFPFSPVHTGMTTILANELNIYDKNVNVTILPGISAYVGADIVAGVRHLEIDSLKGRALLVDMGTNGEIFYHDGSTGCNLVTSAAAGPAFEMAGPHKASTLLSNLYGLKKDGIIDNTGLLSDEYFETGYGEFTQKRIRLLQSAKSAIRAAIEMTLLKGGITYADLDVLYIAGVFGENLDIDAAIGIGLISEECRDRIEIVGNTSLKGAVDYLVSSDDHRIETDVKAVTFYLADEPDFQQLYLEHMYL